MSSQEAIVADVSRFLEANRLRNRFLKDELRIGDTCSMIKHISGDATDVKAVRAHVLNLLEEHVGTTDKAPQKRNEHKPHQHK